MEVLECHMGLWILVIIGLDNSSSLVQGQNIIKANADLLADGPQRINFKTWIKT